MNNICPFCNKRKIDGKLYITVPGFKTHSQDLGTERVDYYNLFNIDCCSVCHRRKKRIDKVEKYFRRTSLALFIFSLLMPAFIMGSCGLFYKNIFEVFVPLLFVFALLSLMLSYIIKRYWEYLLKYMK